MTERPTVNLNSFVVSHVKNDFTIEMCESNAMLKQNSCISHSMAADECMFRCISESVAPTNCKTIIRAQAIKIANDIYRLNASTYKNKQ